MSTLSQKRQASHENSNNQLPSMSHSLHRIVLNTQDYLPTTQVLLTSPTAALVYSDSSPAPVVDPNQRSGWLFNKSAAGTDKFNYYFYTQGSEAKTLGHLHSLSAKISIDSWDSLSSAPHFIIYTKPTGVGDAGAWYHSKVVYALSADGDICLGENIQIFAINESRIHSGIREVELKTKITTGTAHQSEEILTIALGSDSGSAINTQILVSELGFDIHGIRQRVKLI